MRRDRERLEDIGAAARTIRRFVAGKDGGGFLEDEVLHNAVLRLLMVVGEEASRISIEFQEAHPEIRWKAIVGFRHRLVHDYLGIDMDAVWEIVSVSVPDLERQVASVLAEADNREPLED